jgi:hypothetical protein
MATDGTWSFETSTFVEATVNAVPLAVPVDVYLAARIWPLSYQADTDRPSAAEAVDRFIAVALVATVRLPPTLPVAE